MICFSRFSIVVRKVAVQKMYFSISEASAMAGEEQYILRYWEREFDELRPRKNRAGNRVYNEKDLAVLMAIKQLLREENYSIKDAKKAITLRFGVLKTDKKSIEKKDAAVRQKKVKSDAMSEKIITSAQSSLPMQKELANITLPRRDVLELCSLLRDVAILIQSL